MEGRQGAPRPRRRAAAGNAAVGRPSGGPPAGDPQEQLQLEEVGEGDWGWEGAPHEGGADEEAVFGGGLGLSMYGDDEDPVAEAEARNTCCICWEPWAAGGAHRVCCIPCGHVYGRSCLYRWLIQSRHATAKCPQCGEQYKYDGIIDLYTTTEHLWDDCQHEQASRQGATKEDASQEVMQSALDVIAQMEEEIARKDEMIARADEVIARMDLCLDQVMACFLELCGSLQKVCNTRKSMCRIEIAVLLLLLLALVTMYPV